MFDPKPLPFDLNEWKNQSFSTRLKWLCQAWVTQGFGAPWAVYVLYIIKLAAFVFIWLLACTQGHHLGGFSNFDQWWYTKDALFVMITWAILFEVLGFGCGSGPLTGRYVPPVTAFLHYLRPGTIKIPLSPGLPIFGGNTRRWLEVLLYALLIIFLLKALVVPQINSINISVIAGLIVFLSISDKSVFLAARSEHYLIALICFAFAEDTIAGCKLTWLAIWIWAATSKLNRHFPYVISIMISNHPLVFLKYIKKKMFVQFPDDLRPSNLSAFLAHMGTVVEYTFPLLLFFGDGGLVTTVGLTMMVLFHFFITSSIPMGVPIEWNIVMVYGAFLLFGHEASIWAFSVASFPLIILLTVCLIVVPALGNIFPQHFSFLLSMRYYAGNWAHSIWLFKKGVEDRLDQHIVKSAKTLPKQLSGFYDDLTCRVLINKVSVFRAMHLHGRIFHDLLKYMVDNPDEYDWRDGENVAGIVLGWNFGEGHLHNEDLLKAIQDKCFFDSGELRCLMVESQPFFRGYQQWRIHDARDGLMLSGRTYISDLLERQPWPNEKTVGFTA